MEKIQPDKARYINLGRDNAYASVCLEEGVVRLGYYAVPNLQGKPLDELRQAVRNACQAAYGGEGKEAAVTNHARQVEDFHLCGPDTLWITSFQGHLWWCFAHLEVEYFGEDRARFPTGSRQRKTIDGWRRTSVNGRPLTLDGLDQQLTKTCGYQGTICGLEPSAFKYLVQVINDEVQ